MNREFIPYEQALELKELGFDYYNIAWYTVIDEKPKIVFLNYGSHLCAPLYQQAFRWFREKYGWIGGVRLLTNSVPGIIGEFTKDKDYSFMIIGTTYEEAELGCLKKLIEIVKNR